MGRKLVCDACRVETPETDIEKKEWTLISLAKLDAPLSIFQRQDICPACTAMIRNLLQLGQI